MKSANSPFAIAFMALACFFTGSAFAAPKPQWTWELPARKPAWEFNGDIPKDSAYTPVVQGNLVLIGCEHNGALLAVDLETGVERWRFYTGGPLRFPPTADAERIYAPSDDGYLYCLDHSGKLLWKFHGGPTNRKVLAHERLTSVWPASARPLIVDGKIFYAAGYWPVDGVFLHSLDAATGKAVWTNGTIQYRPTGNLRVVGKKLFVNGHYGNGTYDTATGTPIVDKEKAPPEEKAATPELPGGRKLTVSATGQIQCSGDQDIVAKTFGKSAKSPQIATPSGLLEAAKVQEGYCIVAGLEDGALVEGLLAGSKLRVIAIDADAAKVEKIRRRLDDAGCFNDHRLAVLVDDPAATTLPPYIASLIVSEKEAPLPESLRPSLRPLGGVWAERAGGKVTVTRREGLPAGTSEWTHEFGTPANTLSVQDKLVKAPLGSLWYGGPASANKYYYAGGYHGTNPVSAEVIDGRMILQGNGLLSAFDVYTGRHLWESPLPKIFVFGELGIHSKDHPHPVRDAKGAQLADVPPSQRSRSTGFNYVSTADGIYVSAGPNLIRFNPIDGKRMSEWKVPLDEKDLCWGVPRVVGGTLVAPAFRPQDMIDADGGHDGNGGEWSGDRMPMAYLVAIDRETGKLLWSRKADWAFLNRGGVAIGAGKVYCIDLLLEAAFPKYKEAGREFPKTPPMLYALDLKSGAVAWSKPLEWRAKGVAYSTERDILVVPCRNKIQWKNGEWLNAVKAKGLDALHGNMRGFRGADGELLWEVNDEAYSDPPLLVGDLLISRSALTFDLKTGKRSERTSALTGKTEHWSFDKAGCNHLIGCDGLVTWRTGFFDLTSGAGSMPLRGMEAGCTATLIPSGGVLNIPNFGQTHLRARTVAMALVNVPDNTFWAINPAQSDKNAAPSPIARAGFLFGAPGSRKADDGTIWMPVREKATNGAVVTGPSVEWVELNPLQTGNWLAASGVVGAVDISVPTNFAGNKPAKDTKGKRRYDVRLHFFEPKTIKPGERVFSVSLEGKPVLEDFDVVKEAGSPLRHVTREFKAIEIDGPLNIQLSAKQGQTILTGVELIARE